MSNNAEHINDLRTEVVKDIYTTCKIARTRIAKIVEVRSFANKLSDLEALLEVIDFMDKKLDAFRSKYNKLKAKEEKRQKQAKDREQEEKNKVQEKDEFDEFEAEGEEDEQEIGNIDLLELGLGEEPPKEAKSKPKKKSKKKKQNLSDNEDNKEEAAHNSEGKESDENKDSEVKNKVIKKLVAPPSGVRKLNSVSGKKQEKDEKPDSNQQKSNLMDLLEF